MSDQPPSELPPAIDALRRAPGMFVREVNYATICAFVEGYDQALSRCFLVGSQRDGTPASQNHSPPGPSRRVTGTSCLM